MDTSGIQLHFVVTIPYILDVIMSCTMHILFKDNKVKLTELIEKHQRLTNEKVWSVSCFLGCEQDPLGKDARTQIAEYDHHEDDLRNEVTQNVDRLAEVSARTTLMWHFRHQHKSWAAWMPEQLLLLKGHQFRMVKAHIFMCTISTYL